MSRFNFHRHAIQSELEQINKKIAAGFQALAEISALDVGASEKEQVFAQDKVCLYRYQPERRLAEVPPVMIVYALVNRPYMVDLETGRSLIESLLHQGLEIYLLDWGYPDAADQALGLNDYVNGYLDRAVDFIRHQHNTSRINLLGICQGGTLSLCYSSLHQHKIANLMTTVTPVDFKTDKDLLSHLVQYVDAELSVEAMGNIPGEFLNWTFLMLKPYQLLDRKYFDLLEVVEDAGKIKNFMRMEKWIFDSPDQVGRAYQEFIEYFYQQNLLIKGELQLARHTVDLQTLTLPVLNIYARTDHIVPVDSAKALAGCISSQDYTEVELDCGHIGLYVSRTSQSKLAPLIAHWLLERSHP